MWLGAYRVVLFDDAQYYIEYNDPVLTTMTSLALPISIGFAYWEFKAEDEKISTLVWFRGAMALLVFHTLQ